MNKLILTNLPDNCKMTFIRNFNKTLLKKCEMSLSSKKELRVLKTVVAKQKEDTGFYKIKRYFSER